MLLLITAFLGCSVGTPIEAPVTNLSYGRQPKSHVLDSFLADVEFKDVAWKRLERRFGNYVLDPATGSSFYFNSETFGRRLVTFLLWGYTLPEHQWADELNKITDQNERDNRFLREWIERTLRKGGVLPNEHLSIVHPVLQPDSTSVLLHPLRLDPIKQLVMVLQQHVGRHTFSSAEVTTSYQVNDKFKKLRTILFVNRVHYWSKLNQWRFFAAIAHIPVDLSLDRQKSLQDLFLQTLSPITFKPLQ